MCTGSKSKLCPFDLNMDKKDGPSKNCSKLLELSASDDLSGFICEVEKGCAVDEFSFWYGKRFGSKKMGFEERTPLMIASMYGSTEILKYIIGTGKVDVNRACGSDGATALHCAAAGGSESSIEVVKILVDASADVNVCDASGNKPCDVIASYPKSLRNSKRKSLELLLNGSLGELAEHEEEQRKAAIQMAKEGSEKKEYPIDTSLPDINDGIYGSDDFRMYCFKVKPCSRAYSHDWTECPFVHPGENARRRDPRKYNYTCVPCPEFKKGACAKNDSCEYAHGVFESWLHPAQYRTRLCKDETGCSRKVCFFAHKPEELRPLYASTGSAIPSPKATPVSSMDMSTLSPLALGSSPILMPTSSTPPMSPAAATCLSPMGGNMWQSKMNITPPALQLPSSRLKTSLNARDLDLDMEMLGLESIRTQQQLRQQLIDEMAGLSSPSYWNNDNRMGDLKPTNLDDVFGSMDSQLLSQLQGLSPRVASSTSSQLYSPSVPHLQGLSPKVSSNGSQMQSQTALQMRQNMNQFQSCYSNIPQSSSPMRKPSTYGFDSSAAVAQAVMNSRSAAFAKRSQSFIDRSGMGHRATNSPPLMSANNMSDWGSPDGKLEWGFNSEDTNKLKRSQSFGFRGGNGGTPTRSSPIAPSQVNEPDVSWVHSLVKDVSSTGTGLYSSEQKHSGGVRDSIPPWLEQMYIDQERIVA